MNIKRLSIIAIATILLTSSMACSGGTTPENCPELGIITAVEDTATPLNTDNLKGSMAPDLTWQIVDCTSLKAIDDKTVSLSDFRGKPVVIIFHKTMNCPGCATQMPFIMGAYEKRATEITILTIYREDKPSAMRNFVTDKGYIFTALADPSDEFAMKIGFGRGAPMTVFVDAKGIIKEFKLLPFQSQEEIEDILRLL